MAESFLSNRNLQDFINKLKIKDEQRRFLLDELPKMDGKERLELLETLKNIYILNEEENQSIKRIEENWIKPQV